MSSLITHARLRRITQIVFAAVCLSMGRELLAYCRWAQGLGPGPVEHPGGAEAFLPISGLLGLRYWLATGQFDPIHPAGLLILLTAMLSAFLLRRGVCGYVCPVGGLAEALGWTGRALRLSTRLPRFLDLTLSGLKYLLLALFLAAILVLMGEAEVRSFLTSPFNITADARMLRFFAEPSATTLAVLGGLALAGLVLPGSWCRYLCPYGALLGLLALAGPTGLRRDLGKCSGCGRCATACPAGLEPGLRARAPECVGCGRCAATCPTPGALSLRFLGRPMPWPAVGLGTAVLFLLAWQGGSALGLWRSALPQAMLKTLYASALGGP